MMSYNFSSWGHVIVCGDFNSRIGGNSDSLTDNEKFHELLNLPEDYVYDTLPPRRSIDQTQTQIDTTNLSPICYGLLILGL